MKLNSKGQADTVFEVLITVILLSFVLLVGTYAMTSLSNSKCSKEIDISLSSFSQIISKTASSPLSSQYFTLQIPACFGRDNEISIMQSPDQYICNHYCPGSLGSCYLLKYQNKNDKVAPLRYLCINISALTNLNSDACANSVTDYEKIDDASKLTQGRYYISSQSITTPMLCIYKRSGP